MTSASSTATSGKVLLCRLHWLDQSLSSSSVSWSIFRIKVLSSRSVFWSISRAWFPHLKGSWLCEEECHKLLETVLSYSQAWIWKLTCDILSQTAYMLIIEHERSWNSRFISTNRHNLLHRILTAKDSQGIKICFDWRKVYLAALCCPNTLFLCTNKYIWGWTGKMIPKNYLKNQQ